MSYPIPVALVVPPASVVVGAPPEGVTAERLLATLLDAARELTEVGG